jgi:glutamate transport system permease protein
MSDLYEVIGPRGRRRTAILEIGCCLALGGVAVLVVWRLVERGEFSAAAWAPFGQAGLWRLLAQGLGNNLRAAGVGMLLSLWFGGWLGLALLARRRGVRWPARAVTEVFRSVPLLMLLYFSSLVLPAYGLRLADFWFLVVALTLYNSAVIADITRAGVLALPRGQTEAAYALGFGPLGTLRLVVLPQAVRAMSPALVSQLVILFKGTALAFVLGGYVELLHSADIIGQYYTRSLLQALSVAAAGFMAVNLALSALARSLHHRQTRRYGTDVVTADPEFGTALPGARQTPRRYTLSGRARKDLLAALATQEVVNGPHWRIEAGAERVEVHRYGPPHAYVSIEVGADRRSYTLRLHEQHGGTGWTATASRTHTDADAAARSARQLLHPQPARHAR